MLTKHKIFDQTLWISTVLSLALAIFCTFLTAIYSILNAFMSPRTAINGPIGLYLWNSMSTLAHVAAVVLFAVEFHSYIQKNVLTKEEQESGWISTNRAELSWSFYILIASFCFIVLNFLFIYLVVRLKRSLMDLKNYYETNMNLLNNDNGILIGSARSMHDMSTQNPYDNNAEHIIEYQRMMSAPHITIQNIQMGTLSNNESPFGRRLGSNNQLRTSKKFKRIVDFIY
jgi:hypothetical protein